MEERDDYGQADNMLLRREEMKHERLKAQASAAEENMKETIAATLKEMAVKKQMVPEVLEAMEDQYGERLRRMKAGERNDIWGSKDREVPDGRGGYVTVSAYSDYTS